MTGKRVNLDDLIEDNNIGPIYPFPFGFTLGTFVGLWQGWWAAMPALDVYAVFLVAYLAFTTASGAYPWSMRP